MKTALKILLTCLFLFAFSIPKPESAEQTDYTHYLDQYVDRSVQPGDDFFQYSVGKWLKDHPIPSNENSWGVGDVVQEETYQRLLKVNKSSEADKTAQKGSNTQKIGDFWHAAMDTAAIEKAGLTPLK